MEAVRKYGVGAGAVRTIAGTMKLHMELEEQIARSRMWKRAWCFSRDLRPMRGRFRRCSARKI